MIRWLLLFAALLFAPAAHAQDLAHQTAAVEDLRSIREIKRLQAEWGYRAIAGDWHGMADLGTDYVEMVLPGGNRAGREAVEAGLRQLFGGVDGVPAGRLNLHMWFSPVITLSAMGDRATGRWRHLALLGEAGVSATWRSTTDVIEYHKTPGGWRIAFIRPHGNFSGSYAEGWTSQAVPDPAPFHYNPDEAGTVLTGRATDTPRAADDLAREASLLLAHGSAQNLANAWGYYLDRGMNDDLAELFTPTATIDVAGQGVYNGAEGVRKWLGRFGEPGLQPGELNDHALLMPLVTVADDGATALVRVVDLGMTGQHGGEAYWSAAIDTFLMVAGEDGKWRIQQLHQRPLMRADYARGWADPLPAAPPIGESQFPDGPPQPVDTAYPGHAFAMQALPPGVVFPARTPGGAVRVVPEALALAEAFDGAENVSNAYGYYIDRFAWRDTAALFATQGWKELSYIGTFIGRDHVLASLITRYGEGGPSAANQTLHQKVQPYVTALEPGRAQIRTRLLQMNSTPTGPGSMIFGIYENQVIKEGGVWRLHGMDLDYTVLANYAGGWAAADPEASRRFAPPAETLARFQIDAPLRGEMFAPYPRVAPFGFHYANPVSGREPPLRLTWSNGRRD